MTPVVRRVPATLLALPVTACGGSSPNAPGDLSGTYAYGSGDATSTSTTLLCDVSPFPGWGWASTRPDSVRALVVPGHETLVALQCK